MRDITVPISVQDCISRSKVFDAQCAGLRNVYKFMQKYF